MFIKAYNQIPKSCAVLFTLEYKDLLAYECHTLHHWSLKIHEALQCIHMHLMNTNEICMLNA